LLVVIAIIAILAAILFPVFAQARESARQSSCLSNTKQVGLGILQYVQDYDEKFPIWCYYINGDPNIWSGMFGNTAPYGGADKPWGPWKNIHVGWDKAVQPYIKNIQIFHCPSQGDGADTSAAQSGHGDDDQGPTGAVNYALNGHISKRDQNGDNTLAQIRFPAVFVLLAESSKGSSTGETTSEVNWMEWGWNGGHVHQLNGDGSADSAGTATTLAVTAAKSTRCAIKGPTFNGASRTGCAHTRVARTTGSATDIPSGMPVMRRASSGIALARYRATSPAVP